MKKRLSFWAGFLLLHLLWLLGAALLRSRALPGPLEVYSHLGELFAAGILRHACRSLGRVLSGLLLAVAAGLPLGLLAARSTVWGRLLNPLVRFCYPIPKTALLPVAMLLLGLGDRSKILLLALTAVFQVIVTVRDAAKGLDSRFYDLPRSAGAGRAALFFHVTLPALLPGLFTCLRIGTGTSLAVLLLVEAYGTRWGLGYFILDAWSRIDYIGMYGGIAALSLTGALLFALLDASSRRICRWTAENPGS